MIDETDLETCRELWMKDVDRHAVERSSLEARIAELERELDEVKGAFLRDDTARSYAAAIRHAREERDDLASQLAVAVGALTTIKQVYEARSELFTDDAALAENLAARANKALAALDVEGK